MSYCYDMWAKRSDTDFYTWPRTALGLFPFHPQLSVSEMLSMSVTLGKFGPCGLPFLICKMGIVILASLHCYMDLIKYSM